MHIQLSRLRSLLSNWNVPPAQNTTTEMVAEVYLNTQFVNISLYEKNAFILLSLRPSYSHTHLLHISLYINSTFMIPSLRAPRRTLEDLCFFISSLQQWHISRECWSFLTIYCVSLTWNRNVKVAQACHWLYKWLSRDKPSWTMQNLTAFTDVFFQTNSNLCIENL